MSRIAAPSVRVRLADVAAAAGVSAMTVSRALHDPTRLHPATLKRIRAEISTLGYLPNQNARSLASRRSRIIAAIVPTLSNSVYAGTLQGLSDGVRKFGFELMLGDSGYDPAIEESLVSAFIGRGVDALVLTGVEHSLPTRDMVRSHRVPVAETWDIGPRPLGLAIGFSNRAAGAAVGALLASLGRKRWGFVGVHPSREHRSRKRMEGFCAGATRHGVAAPVFGFVENGMSVEQGARAARALLSAHRLDAVFCANDVLACGVLRCGQTSRLRIPEDLAVVGFGDFDVAAVAHPALTTIRIPGYRIGLTAAERLLSLLDGAPPDSARVDLGFEVVRRASA